jgi:hypothetical protein
MWEVVMAVMITMSPNAPPPDITNCSDVSFRQDNLAMCNQPGWQGRGGGGNSGEKNRGLLGLGIGPL